MKQNIEKESGPVYSAEQVTQAETILRKPWQRTVFIGGIAAAILLPFIVQYFAR